MPIPKPKKGEHKKKYIARCLKNKNMRKYHIKQRNAICFTTLRRFRVKKK